jgi:hypothetical protein
MSDRQPGPQAGHASERRRVIHSGRTVGRQRLRTARLLTLFRQPVCAKSDLFPAQQHLSYEILGRIGRSLSKGPKKTNYEPSIIFVAFSVR